jgi:hypothetical protein
MASYLFTVMNDDCDTAYERAISAPIRKYDDIRPPIHPG